MRSQYLKIQDMNFGRFNTVNTFLCRKNVNATC